MITNTFKVYRPSEALLCNMISAQSDKKNNAFLLFKQEFLADKYNGLDLSRCEFTSDDIIRMVEMLKEGEAPKLISLDLSHNLLSHLRLDYLPLLLEKTPALSALYMNDCAILKSEFDTLALALSKTPDLSILELGHSAIDTKELPLLINSLPNLRKLNIAHAGTVCIGSIDSCDPNSVPRCFPKLESLDLGQNAIYIDNNSKNPEDYTTFHALFMVFPGLKHLSFSRDNIGSLGMGGLSSALWRVEGLQSLEIQEIPCSAKALEELEAYIIKNDTEICKLKISFESTNEAINAAYAQLQKTVAANIKKIRNQAIAAGRAMQCCFERHNENTLLKKIGDYLSDTPQIMKDYEGGIKIQKQVFLKQYTANTSTSSAPNFQAKKAKL